MGPILIRIVAATIAASFLAGCKGTGSKGKASDAGSGIFGRKKGSKYFGTAAALEKERAKRVAANGLGDPSWQRDANRAIGDARSKLPGFDPNRAPRRNPNVHIPVDPNRARALTYSRVRVNGPYIALTVDDGPHPVNTPRLLDILKARNIKATFYVVGTNARRHPAILRRMVAEGHEIGNHTVNHKYVSKISEAAAKAEVRNCEKAIVDATGVRPRTFRPPGGFINDRVKLWLKDDFNYSTIMWAVDPQDWRRPGSSVVAQRILRDTDPGEIVLVHDIHAPTITAMPRTLDGLLSKGFRFVTVSQLIAMERSAIADTKEGNKGEPEPAAETLTLGEIEESSAPAVEPQPLPSIDPAAGTAEASVGE